MKKTLAAMMATALIATLSACGGDEATATSRFEGKSEAEMFEVVRESLCAKFVACGDPATLEECEALMDDARNYQAPIDEATRAQIDACLGEIEALACDALEGDAPLPGDCVDVEEFLDLK